MHTAAAAVAYTVAEQQLSQIDATCTYMYSDNPVDLLHAVILYSKQASKLTTIKQKTRSLTALTLRRS